MNSGFLKQVEEMGLIAGQNDLAMYHLGLAVAEAATIHKNMMTDPKAILQTFWIGRANGRGTRLPVPEPGKVQVSKLNTFVKVGKSLGAPGIDMLRRVPTQFHENDQFGGAYNIAIEVNRESLKKKRALTNAEIVEVLKEGKWKGKR